MQLVRRPRLVERLQQAVERPLTLIAAPAGFGKTTLLSTWLEHASLPTAWVSLEQDDDDLTRFWSYVFTALSRVHQGLGTSALSLLQASPLSPLPPIETVLTVWINELATLPHEMALVPDLHRRASTWYEQHEMFREAVHHALTTADFAQAARLIEHTAEMTAKRGELATLRAWLEALPADLVRLRVELCLWQGWLLTLSGQYDVAERLLQDLEPRLRTSTTSSELPATSDAMEPPRQGVSQRGLIEYAGRAAAIRAFIAYRHGDIPRTIDLALQALEQLPEDQAFRGLVAWYLGIAYLYSGDLAKGSASLSEARASSLAAGNSYTAFMATYELAQMKARQGYLHQADQSYQRALELGAERGGRLAATGPAYVGRGQLQREWNDLDTAAHSLQEGIARCQQTGNVSIMLMGHITLARVKQAQGDAAGADLLIQQIPQILRTSRLSPLEAAHGSAWQARLALAQGDLALASRWVQERQLGVDDELSPPREMEYLLLARVLIAQHRPREALPMLGRLLRLAEREGRMGNALAILVLQALASRASGDEAGAMEHPRQSRRHALPVRKPSGGWSGGQIAIGTSCKVSRWCSSRS